MKVTISVIIISIMGPSNPRTAIRFLKASQSNTTERATLWKHSTGSYAWVIWTPIGDTNACRIYKDFIWIQTSGLKCSLHLGEGMMVCAQLNQVCCVLWIGMGKAKADSRSALPDTAVHSILETSALWQKLLSYQNDQAIKWFLREKGSLNNPEVISNARTKTVKHQICTDYMTPSFFLPSF